MKKTLLIIASLAFSFTSYAQLEVTSEGKVIIASNQSTSYAKLLVGNNQNQRGRFSLITFSAVIFAQ
jgi:hypothetical protein